MKNKVLCLVVLFFAQTVHSSDEGSPISPRSAVRAILEGYRAIQTKPTAAITAKIAQLTQKEANYEKRVQEASTSHRSLLENSAYYESCTVEQARADRAKIAEYEATQQGLSTKITEIQGAIAYLRQFVDWVEV
jgi:hypothetical protein